MATPQAEKAFPVSWDQFHRDARALAWRLAAAGPFKAVVCITRGGLVLTHGCQPVRRALLDFWQADAEGAYDNRGFRLRGHQFTDGEGRYRLRTIVPARYPGRTPHIHVKVQAANRPALTTQLYFPGDPGNARDPLFRKELQLRMTGGGENRAGQFDFVLDMA